MTTQWEKNVRALCDTLQNLSVTDVSGNMIQPEEGLREWQAMALNVHSNRGSIFFIGNGASASMASHFAADVVKNAGIRTRVFTDPALITALANDIRYEDVYAEPLRWYMQSGDLLIAISSSGNSPNVVNAVRAAGDLGGTVVTLSAMGENNSIRTMGDINFYIPAQSYGMAETAHAALLHYWMDAIERR